MISWSDVSRIRPESRFAYLIIPLGYDSWPMSRKLEQNSRSQISAESLGEVVTQVMDKGYQMNFDVTMELATKRLRVGTLRVYGRIESGSQKKK